MATVVVRDVDGFILYTYELADPIEFIPITIVVVPGKCECGAAKVGVADRQKGHSSWCPVAP